MAGKTVAGRRHKSWESRYEEGTGGKAQVSEGMGWEIVSYLLAGLFAYGLIGWGVAYLTHMEFFIPIGMVFGIALSLWWVVYKNGRSK